MRGRDGVGTAHNSGDYRDNTTRYSEGATVQSMSTLQGGRLIAARLPTDNKKLRNCNAGSTARASGKGGVVTTAYTTRYTIQTS